MKDKDNNSVTLQIHPFLKPSLGLLCPRPIPILKILGREVPEYLRVILLGMITLTHCEQLTSIFASNHKQSVMYGIIIWEIMKAYFW